MVNSGGTLGSEKCTEWAANRPFHRVFGNRSASGKDRRRYALYLTVFGFPADVHLKKTVKSSSQGKRKMLDLTRFYL